MHQTLAQHKALKHMKLPPSHREICECNISGDADIAGQFARYVRVNFKNQTEAAKHFSVTPQYINAICNGRKAPNKAMLEAIGLEQRLIAKKPDGDILTATLEALLQHGLTIAEVRRDSPQPVITVLDHPFVRQLGGEVIGYEREHLDDGGHTERTAKIAAYGSCLLRWVETATKLGDDDE